jgi:hypothetical protein
MSLLRDCAIYAMVPTECSIDYYYEQGLGLIGLPRKLRHL